MRKIITLSLIAVVAVVMTAGVALANYGKDNKITGYVKVKGTLTPIKAVKIKVYTVGGTKKGSDTTSLKGKYSIKRLTENKYVVRAKAVGYHDPKNVKKNTMSSKFKVDGTKKKNFYFAQDI